MKLARRVKREYGTWQAVRDASRRENGVYVIEGKGASADHAHHDLKKPITA